MFYGGGVVLQHVQGYIYSSDYISYSVWWVVALFIMIGGYNSYTSYQNRGCFQLKKKISGIFIPYFFATMIYTIYNYHYFDALTFLQSLLHFNASGPMYYVAVYIQLLIISPVLIGVIDRCEKRKWLCIPFWMITFCIAASTTLYSNLFDIAIGGGNLFAGPWILFWVLGMCIKNVQKNIEIKPEMQKWVIVGMTLIIILWQYVFVNKGVNLELGSMFHGTQVGMTWANAFETVLIFFWFRYAVEIFKRNAGNIGKQIIKPLDFTGRYTLYIFLYHMLFLSFYIKNLEISAKYMNRWLCLVFIFVGPVIWGLILKWVKDSFRRIIKEVRVE